MANISFKNVTKKYDKNGKYVIPGISFDIQDKEFVVFVGPSGCGKSTTLRMIAGLEEITSGELYIDGKLVNDVAPKDRDIAMVFQSYALYPHLSVYKNMAFALKMRKEPKDVIDEKVRWAVKILDLEEYLERKPRALSGGQRQRVALGRAMVRKPKVFLLDEPLSNLDAKLRTEMRSEITRLHRELQTTFVYVTHDQTEAMTMADRIVVLKDGIIQQYDTPQNLYEKPVNMFVAGFIGSPQMNFIDAKIIKEDDKWYALFKEDLSGNDYKLELPESKYENGKLDNYVDKDVIIGIRPDNFYLLDETNDHFSTIYKANVYIAELMGSEIYAYFMVNGKKTIAKIPSISHIKANQDINMVIDRKMIHIFDKDTTITITN